MSLHDIVWLYVVLVLSQYLLCLSLSRIEDDERPEDIDPFVHLRYFFGSLLPGVVIFFTILFGLTPVCRWLFKERSFKRSKV